LTQHFFSIKPWDGCEVRYCFNSAIRFCAAFAHDEPG